MKKILAFLLAVSMILAMAACAAAPAQTTTEPAKTEETPATENTATEAPAETEAAAPVEEENLTETQKIIKEAEGMSLEELAKKAIEESNGKMFYGVGNYYEAEIGDNGYLSYRKTECSCVDWQWNGAMTASERRINPEYSYSSSSATLIYYYYDSHAEGFLVNNAVNGQFRSSCVSTNTNIPGLVLEWTDTRDLINGASDSYICTFKSNSAEIFGDSDANDNIEEACEATVEGAGISYMGENGFWAGTIASYYW